MPPALPGTTTLPLAPHLFWPAALLAALLLTSLLIHHLLDGLSDTRRSRLWAELRPGWLFLAVVLAILWIGLFALTIAAAFFGLWHAIQPAGANVQPNLGLGALLAALLGAPFVIWGTVLKHQTVRYQKEGHITDRISKAVEQLGAEKTVKLPKENGDGSTERTLPNIEVRIGAILSLERIAQDSTKHDKGRDHVRVMEILCAYIRENAPATDLTPTEGEFTTKIPRIDLQMAVTVLGRRSDVQQKLEEKVRYRLDLSRSDLDGMDFRNGSFQGALFNRSRVEAANFWGADLTGALFQRTLLNFCNFNQAEMLGIDLRYAKWTRHHDEGFIFPMSLAALVEAADISGLILTSYEASHFFGSSDTAVEEYLIEEKNLAFNQMRQSFKVVDGKLRVQIPPDTEIPEDKKLFHHWNPYTADDGAAHIFREAFRDRWNLRGWPFED